MKKAIVAALVIAAVAALAWFIVKGTGGSGGPPTLAGALDAAHTVGVMGAEDLDQLAKEADALLQQLPPEMRKDAPAEIFDVAKRAEKLGFDPATAEGWRSIGLDPAAGFAVAVDARFMRGKEPIPLLLARVTDRDKLVAAMNAKGASFAFSDEKGPSAVATSSDERMLWGKRGDVTVVLPLAKGADEAALRTQFDAFLAGSGPALGSDDTFRAALKDGAPRPRVWTFVSSAGAAQLPGVKDAAPADFVTFYTARFRALAFSFGPKAGGFRLLTDGEGAKALRQIAMPRRSAPKMSRYFPKRGWAVSRFSVNLTDLFDGIQALVPPSKGDVKGQILMAKNFLPMAIGASYDDIAAGFTGHVAVGMELPKAPGQVPPVLVVAGVADKEKADAVLKALLNRAKDAGGVESEPFELKGNPGYKVKEGSRTAIVVRAGDVLLGALDQAVVEAALDRPESMSGTPAGKALDGDAIYAVGVGAGWMDAALASAGPDEKAMAEVMKKHLPAEGFAATIELDDQGLKSGGAGGVTVAAMTGILAAVAIPSFVKYQKRAKTTEATANVRRLYDGAVAYYNEERVDAEGNVLPRQFPPTAPLTPADDYCKQGRDRYEPDPKAWDHPTWKALHFGLDAPHRYRYELVSSPTGFTARAVGDLDCDGVLSTFERVGTIGADGEVDGGGGLFTENETE